MKQARPIISIGLVIILLIGAFAFGQYVRHTAIAVRLPQAKILGSQQIRSGNAAYAMDAQGGSDPHLLPVPIRSAQAASDPPGDQGANDYVGNGSPVVTFQQVYELLKEQYVNKIPSDTPLSHGAVSALVASLDEPNSRFIEAPERTALENQSKGTYAGSGIVFTVRRVTTDGIVNREITVVDAVPGSPAAKAGLQTGDVITDIDGHWIIAYDPFASQTKLFKKLSNDPVDLNKIIDATDKKITSGLTLAKAQTQLDTDATNALVLDVTRPGTPKPLKFTLDCTTPTQITDVESRTLDGGSGYIRVNAFETGTGASFQHALAGLASARGVVVDLRDCPGGEIDPAVAIGEALAPGVPFAKIIERDNKASVADKTLGFGTRTEPLGTATAQAQATAATSVYKGHLVVLTNHGTANSAELLASFLHDRLGARIVGATTFGDGSALTLFPLSDGSAFTLTTGTVKTSSGHAFEKTGIAPDVTVADAGANSAEALNKAVSLLSLDPLSAEARAVGTKTAQGKS